MADVSEFVRGIPNFHRVSKVEQLLALAWYIHVHERLDEFSLNRLRDLFRAAETEAPDLTVYVRRLTAKRPPQIVQRGTNFRLEGRERRRLDAKIGHHPTTVAVTAILSGLPAKLPNLAEREFLTETLRCYRVGAFRAAIVMAWNLTFDHIRTWILDDPSRIAAFSKGITIRYPKKSLVIRHIDDFEELKESEVVEALNSANLVSGNIISVLREKLGRRNRVAHPSLIEVTQHNVDDTITDLVNNVILRLGLGRPEHADISNV